jgi:glycosidase
MRFPPYVWLLGALAALPLYAQFNTPTIDGIIEPGEYGNQTEGYNQKTAAGGQTWYMTWDATNLYVGISNANLMEGAVIYIDANPLNPPTSGGNANGNLSGFNYDGAEFASLPFRAQFVTYFKDGYNEYRQSDGTGQWTVPTAYYGVYASGASGNVREFAIPWSAVTGGGLPSSFLFFGYLTSAAGFVYGQLPGENPSGNIGTSAAATNYYAINATTNGAATPPFSIDMGTPGGIDTHALYHNTFDPYYRSAEGAVAGNTSMTLRLRTAHYGADTVNLRVYLYDPATDTTAGPADYPLAFYQTINQNGTYYDTWTITQSMPSTPKIYYYKFWITLNGATEWYSDDYIDDYDNLNKDGTGAAAASEPFDAFQVTVYDPNFQTPAWLENANVYQIFPDRFRQGNPADQYCVAGSTAGCPSFYGLPPSSNIAVTPWNTQLCDPRNSSLPCYNNFGSIFYGGDLSGIQDELDYIQGLGFDTLYLNPIFYGNSNHRYDTDDFLNVDPGLGGNTALANLTRQMSQRGMSLIVDGTFEDASSDSTYFNRYGKFATTGACQSLSSVWRTWFQFLTSNVPCTSTDYNGWSGFDSLPLFDTSQAAVQQFFFSGTPDNVLLHWYNAGASGWRFDSAPSIPHSYWHALRPYAKSYNPYGPLIGEIWSNASQWLAGDQMDSTMNYRFRRNLTGFVRWPYTWVDDNDNGNDAIIPLSPSQFDTANRAVRDDYPLQATQAMLNLIDSHDTNRALYVMTETGDNGLVQAKQRLELAALFQFTYPGAPMVFYGDEVAINAPSLASGPNGPIGDPYTRAPYPWTDQPGNPGIYGPPDQNVMAFYTLMGHLRKQHVSLRNGTFTTLLTGDTQQASTAPNTYAYARQSGSETAIVALNNGSTTNQPTLAVGAYYPDGAEIQDVISGSTYTVTGGNVTLTLPAITGMVLFRAPATVDLTPPTGAVMLTPAPNGNGWLNTSPVTAHISGSDSGSGVSQIRYWVDNGAVASVASASAMTSVSGEGLHTVGARVIDNAGNISGLVNQAANIDLTPPVVMVTGVSQGATYTYGSVPAAGCNTTDALSGVAVQATVQVTGGNGQGTGTFTATCSGATDLAGNLAAPVSVTYTVVPSGTTPTSTTLSIAPNPAQLGQPVTLTAQVSPDPGSGKVTFYDGAAVVGIAPVSSASASFVTSLLSAGSHSLRAQFDGAPDFGSSSSTIMVLSVVAAGASTYLAPVTYSLAAPATAVAAGDFNGDGRPDFVAATGNGISVFLGSGGGSFGAPLNSAAGANPLALATGDFNGDGRLDVTAVNQNAGVSILLGKGDGTFQSAVSYAAGQTPTGVAVGDVNGDGVADLLVTNGVPGVSVLLGNPDGTFQSPLSFTDPNGARAVAVGDLNGDGKADLAVANATNGTVSVLLGNGDGTFQAAVNYPAGGGAWSVALADLNGDGKLDLAVANSSGNSVSVLLGNGDGAFQAAVNYTTSAAPQSVAAADVNGDGRPDLVVAAASGSVDVLLGDGHGGLQPPASFALTNAVSLALADVNGDGREDIVAASGSGRLAAVLAGAQASTTVALSSSQNPSQVQQPVTFTGAVMPAGPFFGAPSGTLTFSDNGSELPGGTVTLSGGSAAYTTASLAAGLHPIFAAYSGDAFFQAGGSNVVNQTVNLIPQTITFPPIPDKSYGDPPFQVSATASSGLPVSYTASGPCTVNGNTVTITGAGTCTITADQPGNAIYAPAPSVSNHFIISKEAESLTLSAPASVQQGQMVTLAAQLAAAPPAGASAVFYDGAAIAGYSAFSPSGSAAFTTTLLAPGPHELRAFYAGNANVQSATSSVQPMSVTAVPSAAFSAAAPYAVGKSPSTVAVGDFNGDGYPDLAVANNDTSSPADSVSILLNTGDGGFSAAQNYAADPGTTGLAVGDFNGDGIPDLALVSKAAQRLTILRGAGNGAFTTVSRKAAGKSPVRAAVADVNGDGLADLVVANSGSSNVSVLLGNGDFTFQNAANYPAGTAPYAVVIGDFNGDGHTDIAVSNQNSNNITVLLGNGDGTFAAGVNYPAGSRPATLVAADFNHDGNLDLAVVNLGSSNTSVLLGRGDGSFQAAVNYMTGKTPAGLVATDLDGDGNLDLAAANNGGNNVTVLDGNGDGTFRSPAAFPSGAKPAALVAGDFNRDGRSDVATAASGANSLSVFLGRTVSTAISLASAPNPSQAGKPVTFSARINVPSGPFFGVPSGSMVFADGGKPLATVPVTGTIVRFVTASLSTGTHSIVAVYSGDARFGRSTSPPLSQVVQ